MNNRWRVFSFVFFLMLVLFMMGGCAAINNNSYSSDASIYKYKRDATDYEKYGREWGKGLYNNNPRITAELATEDMKKPITLGYMWSLIRQDELAYYWGQCADMSGAQWSQYLIDEGYVQDGYFAENETLRPVSRRFIRRLLLNHRGYDFFGVHTDLKEAFKKGFREGYQDRTADLVLGPYLQKAAGIIGDITAIGFVSVINNFETGWNVMLRKAVDVFIELIADGSQAEREQFVKDFIRQYKKKYLYNKDIINGGASNAMMSEGGTRVFLDPKRTQSTLDIPSDQVLKNAIYSQTFVVMGDEMGRRYSHNLISHENLVDWLRRSKLALNLDSGPIDNQLILKNLNTLGKTFAKSYGPDGPNVFADLAKEAGYDNLPRGNERSDNSSRGRRQTWRR